MKEENKEKSKEFMTKAKELFDRGILASKKAFGVAGEAVQDFSDKSVTTIEKKQLEAKVKKQYTLLGEIAAKQLSKKGAAVTTDDEKVCAIMKEIARLNKEIKVRDQALADGKAKAEEKKATSKKCKTAKNVPAKTTAKKSSAKKPAAKTTAANKTTKK